MEPTIVDADEATALLGPIESIEFKDVHFTYPNTSTKVLSGISFSVAGGQFLGVIYRSQTFLQAKFTHDPELNVIIPPAR